MCHWNLQAYLPTGIRTHHPYVSEEIQLLCHSSHPPDPCGGKATHFDALGCTTATAGRCIRPNVENCELKVQIQSHFIQKFEFSWGDELYHVVPQYVLYHMLEDGRKLSQFFRINCNWKLFVENPIDLTWENCTCNCTCNRVFVGMPPMPSSRSPVGVYTLKVLRDYLGPFSTAPKCPNLRPQR